MLLVPISSAIALAVAACLMWYISKQESGTKEMIKINRAIKPVPKHT